MVRSALLVLAVALPSIARAADPPERYVQDRWRHTRDTATLGAVVGGLGVATAATGIALQDQDAVPSGLMIGTGTLAAAGGATIVSVVGLQQRYEFLDRENSAFGSYMSLGLVGLSGIALLGAAATDPGGSVHDTLLYGSAGLGTAALVAGGFQLGSNGSRFHSKNADLAWAPIVAPNRVGVVVVF